MVAMSASTKADRMGGNLIQSNKYLRNRRLRRLLILRTVITSTMIETGYRIKIPRDFLKRWLSGR